MCGGKQNAPTAFKICNFIEKVTANPKPNHSQMFCVSVSLSTAHVPFRSTGSLSRPSGVSGASSSRSVQPRRHKNSRRNEILTFIKDTVKTKSM